jgi:hypothetical protein
MLPPAKLMESDARRAEIASWSQIKLQMGDNSAAPPDFLAWRSSEEFTTYPSELIKSALAKVIIAAREGLEPFVWRHAMTLYKVYALLGDEKNFRRWRGFFRDLILINLGVTSELEIADRQIEDPANTVMEWNQWTLAARAAGTIKGSAG